MELRWNASFSCSCIHAVEALCSDRTLCDAKLSGVLVPCAHRLRQAITAWQLPAQRFWQNLTALSASIASNRELAERTLSKTSGQVDAKLVDQLTAEISSIEEAVNRLYPDLAQQLLLRIGPIRSHWEARGPGLLRSIARLTDERVLVPNAEVILVHPALGGAGVAHLNFNSIRIEGLLTNRIPQLPEPLRIGWLLSQLNVDLPVFADAVHSDRLPLVAQLAFLPVVLKAAEEMEWTEFSAENLRCALDAWQVAVPQGFDGVEVVMNWWGTFSESASRWEVAVAALDRMLM